jgi:hypothetical protein
MHLLTKHKKSSLNCDLSTKKKYNSIILAVIINNSSINNVGNLVRWHNRNQMQAIALSKHVNFVFAGCGHKKGKSIMTSKAEWLNAVTTTTRFKTYSMSVYLAHYT